MLQDITFDTFKQLKYILNQINEEDYNNKLKVLGNASIGQHVRHIVEFYLCLSKGIEIKEVNYDLRKRDIMLETSPSYALQTLEYLYTIFSTLHLGDSELLNVLEYQGENIIAKSTVNRELIYLIEHNIHHFAIIKIGILQNFEYISLPENFGIAYSTVKHQNAFEIISH